MKLTFRFRSLKDWGDLTHGYELLDILHSYGLTIQKADSREPIRREFNQEKLPSFWPGPGIPGQHSTGYFLFKGRKSWPFSGSAVSESNLPPGSMLFNRLRLELTLNARSKPDKNVLLGLGDRLFEWSEAVHGFISSAPYDPLAQPPNKRHYLPGLFWVNYFGRAYVENPDFHIGLPSVALSGGVRCLLADSPDAAVLTDEGFLREAKTKFGLGWFGEGKENELRIPVLDFSNLWREAE